MSVDLTEKADKRENKCKELTDYIQQIIRRNRREDFLQLLLTTAIALEKQINK